MKPAILAIIIIVMVAIGVAGGLLYTWVLDPVEYYDTAPDALHIQDKSIYANIIGDLYICEGDLNLTQARLAALGLEADGLTLTDLIEQYLDSGGRPEDARNVAQLARDLGASGGVLLVFGAEPVSSPQVDPSPTVPATDPALAPTMTPAPSFRLVEQTALCADAGQPGRIGIWVEDEGGIGLSGIQVVVSWAMGQDRLSTGLRPEQGKGYADFEMKPKVEYEVTLAELRGDVAEGLRSELAAGICPTDTIALDWRLVFQRVQ